jgi:hypothetical protein
MMASILDVEIGAICLKDKRPAGHGSALCLRSAAEQGLGLGPVQREHSLDEGHLCPSVALSLGVIPGVAIAT